MAGLSLHSLKKSFGKHEIVKGIDLDIQDNEFVVFVGPSGCGKSTLLRLIAGLEESTEGVIKIDGEDVTMLPPSKRGISMVFQSYALYPHMTVFENMAFGLKIGKNSKKEIQEKVEKTAKILQIDSLLNRKPKELSGGQRQRVAIGRAIVREPKVFLFDEPLSNLDAALRIQMRMEIAKLKATLKTTMVYVTHDQTEAMTLADKIVVLRDGNVEQVGSPLQLYHHPRNLFVAGFLGSPAMNFVPSTITHVERDHMTVEFCGKELSIPLNSHSAILDAKTGSKITLGIRPEDITLSKKNAKSHKGSVSMVERLGGETYVYITIEGSQTILLKASGDEAIKINDDISFVFDAKDIHIFDDNGLSFERLPISF